MSLKGCSSKANQTRWMFVKCLAPSLHVTSFKKCHGFLESTDQSMLCSNIVKLKKRKLKKNLFPISSLPPPSLSLFPRASSSSLCGCVVVGYVGHVCSSGGQVQASAGQSSSGSSTWRGHCDDTHFQQGETPGEFTVTRSLHTLKVLLSFPKWGVWSRRCAERYVSWYRSNDTIFCNILRYFRHHDILRVFFPPNVTVVQVWS